jgi:hypothetical protein
MLDACGNAGGADAPAEPGIAAARRCRDDDVRQPRRTARFARRSLRPELPPERQTQARRQTDTARQEAGAWQFRQAAFEASPPEATVPRYVKIEPGNELHLAVVAQLAKDAPVGSARVVGVVERVDGRITGGVTLVLESH